MGRNLLAAGVVAADTALLVAGHRGGLPLWSVLAYAAIVAAVIVLGRRAPAAGLAAALILAALAGGGYVLLLWTAYHAGRCLLSWPRVAVALGAALACLGAQAALAPAGTRALGGLVASYLVFAALPLLTGRYLTQQERLVSALGQHGEQERQRLAGDMHDALGHRLSLVSVQAAALEVAPLPPDQRAAAGRLAAAARGALEDLHELVGVLRAPPGRAGTGPREPGADGIDGLLAEFLAAGMRAEFRQRGVREPLPAASGQAAYRVVREGLTNAARHAPGQPVTVSLDWQPGALLVTISNELPPAARTGAAGSGLGLAGLSERARSAGGFLDHGVSAGRFRLFAMLPLTGPDVGRGGPEARRAVLGRAVAVLMFVILPVTLLLGVR
jgi:signal transduction histidine kinase